MLEQNVHIYLNPVQVHLADEFEKFLADVVAPAVAAQRPQLADQWRVLKPTLPEPADADVITYAFIFDGGDLANDWDLETLLPAQYGQEEANRLLKKWTSTFAPYRTWIAALGDHAEEPAQIGWTFTPAVRQATHKEGNAAG